MTCNPPRLAYKDQHGVDRTWQLTSVSILRRGLAILTAGMWWELRQCVPRDVEGGGVANDGYRRCFRRRSRLKV